MASLDILPKFFVREDKRVAVYGGLPSPELLVENKWTEKASACGAMTFNSNGSLMATSCTANVMLFGVNPWKQNLRIDETDVTNLYFSPKGSILCTYKPHCAQAVDNLKLWCVKTGRMLASFIEQNRDNWHPQWSDDESLAIRMAGKEVHLYACNAFAAPVQQSTLAKMRDVALSPGSSPLYIATYNYAQETGLSSASLYRCSASNAVGQMVTNKVFAADRVDFFWNKRGKAVVIMAMTDVDPENKSYYGRESLHLLKTDGEACTVVLGRGIVPVHAVQWHADSKLFCVVHGSMPAAATLFDLKADAVFTFPPGPRNDLCFNSFGNLLCLCGFGSVPGNMEFWSMDTKRLVAHFEADQTTFVQWCPDGVHFLTATTAPRLRVNNGYKLWHYTGKLVYEFKLAEGAQLFQIGWSPEGTDSYKQPVVDLQAIANSKPVVIAKPKAYVPPHLRAGNAIPGSAPCVDGKQADAARKKKKKAKAAAGSSSSPFVTAADTSGSGDFVGERTEREKRMQVICRKLREIGQLKEKIQGGYQMKPNQVPKLASEDSLLAELELLKNSL